MADVEQHDRIERAMGTPQVPDYKTDAAQKAEWETKRSAGTLPAMSGGKQVVPAGI